MAYHALHKLQDNIVALRTAFALAHGEVPTGDAVVLLQRYSGFGGIKAVLYGDGDKTSWKAKGATDADMRLFDSMQELYTLLREHTDNAQYEKVLDSLKTNILTAFYTPSFIPQTLFSALEDTGIQPKSLYEPSAGSGVFIEAGINAFPTLEKVRAVEKDLLTGRILGAINRSYPVPVDTLVAGLEYSSNTDDGTADLVVSNIPFGNFKVFDPLYIDKGKVLTDRIHNYFFAKGLDKLGDGGLMAYITTDTFLNSPGNKVAREYLFGQADFISLAVLPENLMSDTGGTDAPSHLLLVQKHSDKTAFSVEEQQLLETVVQENEYGSYTLNTFVVAHPEFMLGNSINAGRNQYGKAQLKVRQDGDIETIAPALSSLLTTDIRQRLSLTRFEQSLTRGLPLHR